MPENYEVVYTHPGGATATFIRHDGELDALARGLGAEQFWTFKQVKSLLVRNDPEDLDLATQQMAAAGFSARVRVITTPVPVIEPVYAPAVAAEEVHVGPHLPGPSYWPLSLAASATVVGIGLLLWLNVLDTPFALPIIAIGFVCVFISWLGWAFEPI